MDLDFSLVSTKNLSEILPSCGWRPGPDDLGQKQPKPPHLQDHPQKCNSAFILLQWLEFIRIHLWPLLWSLQSLLITCIYNQTWI